MTAKREKSLLLELLNARKAWDLPEYRVPQVDDHALSIALELHERADDSDPHSRARMRLHIKSGFELASDVAKDAQRRIRSRSQEPCAALSGLEPVKRRIEEQQAWNQHRSAQYVENHK